MNHGEPRDWATESADHSKNEPSADGLPHEILIHTMPHMGWLRTYMMYLECESVGEHTCTSYYSFFSTLSSSFYSALSSSFTTTPDIITIDSCWLSLVESLIFNKGVTAFFKNQWIDKWYLSSLPFFKGIIDYPLCDCWLLGRSSPIHPHQNHGKLERPRWNSSNPHLRDSQGPHVVDVTLWLCQNSYWKWPFIVEFPIKHGDFL